MSFTAESIAYSATGSFSKIVLDYLADVPGLRPFYEYRPDYTGIKKAISDRKDFPVNRKLLVSNLKTQYESMAISDTLRANIDALSDENTFTVCTAHQPNIFTGHLYFIYKILHAVRLCDELNKEIHGSKFVPLYYMGSEDADLEELGEIHLNGKQYRWNTKQTGAVGRMKIDREFLLLLDDLEGQLSVAPHGKSFIAAVRESYRAGSSIEQATLSFVHTLFNEMGLVILLPDSRELKKEFVPLMEKELSEQFSKTATVATVAAFPKEYKVQAAGRDINLFYLTEGGRDRIEQTDTGYRIANTRTEFTQAEIKQELATAPERFSPNVILRPVYQETILPNVAFIGGGGELAYWLELKNVFNAAKTFFPVLILRNSFAIISKRDSVLIEKLHLSTTDLFVPQQVLFDRIIKASSALRLELADEKAELKTVYGKIKTAAGEIDSTLQCHVHALRMQALHRLDVLEKKMIRAERKKFEALERQLNKLKNSLFPGGTLQERVHNVLEYLAEYDMDFLQVLLENSPALKSSFTVITKT